MEIVANGRINSEGRLVISPDERAEFLAEISRKRNKGCRVKVVVDGKKRSLEQNSYYYGVVVGIPPIVRDDTCLFPVEMDIF